MVLQQLHSVARRLSSGHIQGVHRLVAYGVMHSWRVAICGGSVAATIKACDGREGLWHATVLLLS